MASKSWKILPLFITAIILTLGLSISFQSLLAAWTAPLANPPTCAAGNPGCDAPLNVGALMQTKSGPLWINTGVSPTGLIVEKGNVGIGTAAPDYPLTIRTYDAGAGRTTERDSLKLLADNGNNPYTGFGPHITLSGYVYVTGIRDFAQIAAVMGSDYNNAGDLLFRTRTSEAAGLSEKMRILGNGNVGIGTASPGAKLEVNGDIGAGGNIIQKYGYPIYPGSVSGLTDWQISYYIASHASWGLYTNTSMYSAGGFYAPGFYYASDRNLKKDIKPLSDSLEDILKLRGVEFKWKDTGKSSIGLIAQEVEKVIPDVVVTNKEGIKSVNYGALTGPLIEAIKEQQKEIEGLKAEIENLKN